MVNIIDIKKKYGKKTVLKNISLSLKKGTCVGILGGNGCGKSTLLNALTGIIKTDGGAFMYDEINLLKERSLLSKKVGYVPQTTPLFEELTALDNLKLWYDKKTLDNELSDGVLAMLGIDEFLKTPVKKMSGGMKKRLSIGCVVAANPEILLLDEPSAALDLICKARISTYIENFKKNGGIVLIATHDLQEISLCDELYILKNGVLTPYSFDGNVNRLAGNL